MAKVATVRQAAQQPVQGGHLMRNTVPDLAAAGTFQLQISQRQTVNAAANGFTQSGGGLAGWRGQMNLQRVKLLAQAQSLQQGEQTHHGGGFAGTRTAGNNGKAAARSQQAGDFLPVGARCLVIGKQQCQQAAAGLLRQLVLLLQTLRQRAANLLFILPVTAQIQQWPVTGAGQYQRAAVIGLILLLVLLALISHCGAGA